MRSFSIAVAGIALLFGCGGTAFTHAIANDEGLSSDAGQGSNEADASASSTDAGDDGPALSADAAGGDARHDAGPSVDGAVGPPTDAAVSTLSCGSLSCDPSTQYCFLKGTGSGREANCRSIPSACNPSPSCSCIESHDIQCASPSCTADNGDVTITCSGL